MIRWRIASDGGEDCGDTKRGREGKGSNLVAEESLKKGLRGKKTHKKTVFNRISLNYSGGSATQRRV